MKKKNQDKIANEREIYVTSTHLLHRFYSRICFLHALQSEHFLLAY
jgi:hypothetical protein